MSNFKSQFGQYLSSNNTKEDLKSQLRSKMIQSLGKKKTKQMDFNQKIIVSLIQEYLESYQLTSSLNVFLPESGFEGNVHMRQDIEGLLNLKGLEEGPILSQIVGNLYAHKKFQNQSNQYTQTYQTAVASTQGIVHNDELMDFEAQLRLIDQKHQMKKENMAPNLAQGLINSMTGQNQDITQLKAELEKKYNDQKEAEIRKIREFEITQMRMQEKEIHRNDMEEYRNQMEQTYQQKQTRLRQREKDQEERQKERAKMTEDTIHNNRQQIMKEFELISLKEQELKRMLEAQKITEKERDKLIKIREQNIEDKEKKLDSEYNRIKNSLEAEYITKKQQYINELENDKIDTMEKQRKVDKELYRIESMKTQIAQLNEQNKKLIEENQEYQNKQNEVHEIKLRTTQDQSLLKDQQNTLQLQLQNERQKVVQIEHKLDLKEQAVQHLEKELDDIKDMQNQQKTVYERTNYEMKQQINNLQSHTEKQNIRLQVMKQGEEFSQTQIQQAPWQTTTSFQNTGKLLSKDEILGKKKKPQERQQKIEQYKRESEMFKGQESAGFFFKTNIDDLISSNLMDTNQFSQKFQTTQPENIYQSKSKSKDRTQYQNSNYTNKFMDLDDLKKQKEMSYQLMNKGKQNSFQGDSFVPKQNNFTETLKTNQTNSKNNKFQEQMNNNVSNLIEDVCQSLDETEFNSKFQQKSKPEDIFQTKKVKEEVQMKQLPKVIEEVKELNESPLKKQEQKKANALPPFQKPVEVSKEELPRKNEFKPKTIESKEEETFIPKKKSSFKDRLKNTYDYVDTTVPEPIPEPKKAPFPEPIKKASPKESGFNYNFDSDKSDLSKPKSIALTKKQSEYDYNYDNFDQNIEEEYKAPPKKEKKNVDVDDFLDIIEDYEQSQQLESSYNKQSFDKHDFPKKPVVQKTEDKEQIQEEEIDEYIEEEFEFESI